MAKKRALPARPNIPLRLRRRRDGTVALVDADGRVSAPERAFPESHLFTHDWLATGGVATVDGDEISVELVNARATYEITERTPAGFFANLVSAELTDAPPVDEERAVVVVAEARARRIAEEAERYGVEPGAMESILVGLGQMRPAHEANAPQSGEA